MSIFLKEVMADAINEKLGKTLRIANLAFDATGLVSEIVSAGDVINFPKFTRVATVGEITKGNAVVPSEVSMTENKATIKQVGGSIRVYDKDAKQIQGAVADNMILQISDSMRESIDSDLAKEMLENAIKKSPTADALSITSTELMNGMALFGDDIDTESFSGIIINSRLYPSLIAMPEFTSTEKTYATYQNGLVNNGLCGFWLGIPVIVCNNETFDTTNNECTTFMAKKNALGYVFQKQIGVEEEREAKLFATDIVASSLYAVKLINKDDVVVIKKTIA